jgi:small subunit ribosomal protein S16
MVKIRLKRIGAKKAPFYRVVVADGRYPRNGRFIEELGTYDPLQNPPVINIDIEKANAWMKNGAQPTDTVRALIERMVSGKNPATSANKPSRKAVAKLAESEKAAEEAANAPAEEAPAEEAAVEEAVTEEAAAVEEAPAAEEAPAEDTDAE